MSMLLDISKKTHDIRKVRDCIRSDSAKRNIENKQKFIYWWFQQIKIYCVQLFKSTFYETTIIFLKFSEVSAAYVHWKQNHVDFNEGR